MNEQKTQPPPFWDKSPKEWALLSSQMEAENSEALRRPLGYAVPQEARNQSKLGYDKTAKPDYARFMALISYTGGSRGGYSRFPSWEMVDFNGNEQQGLEDLINRVIKSIPVEELKEAKIFANLTLNLRTDSKNYNYPIACYKPVFRKKYGKEVRNVWEKKTIAFEIINGKRRVDINSTLTLQRLARNTIYVTPKLKAI